jgi:hypothetical protein
MLKPAHCLEKTRVYWLLQKSEAYRHLAMQFEHREVANATMRCQWCTRFRQYFCVLPIAP